MRRTINRGSSNGHSTDYFPTVNEYLRLEEAAEFRSEYIDGHMVAMAGSTKNRSAIGSNLIRELGNGLREHDCTVFGSDMRLRTGESEIYTYADAVVSCDRIQVINNTLVNPTVIAEVLSNSTEAYDRGKNLQRIARWQVSRTTFLSARQRC